MKAIIFSAGLGTRLAPFTDKNPKALAMVNGKSLLQRNIEYLQKYGITDVIVNIHHHGSKIEAALKKNKGWGSKYTISDETKRLMDTGGGLVRAKKFLSGTEPFVSINVDILTDLNLSAMLENHQKTEAVISVAVKKRDSNRSLIMRDDMRLCGWKNSATDEEVMQLFGHDLRPFGFSGVAMWNGDVFNEIDRRGKYSVKDLLLDLTATTKIVGFEHSDGKWMDVGTPENLEEAEKVFK